MRQTRYFDHARLSLDVRRHMMGMSYKKAAREIGMGVSRNTLHRAVAGHAMGIDTYIALCRWMGVTLDTYINYED